jgi:hypothetical protein
MKVLNSKMHGIIDYLVVLFLFSAPSLFNLPPKTAMFTYVLGCVHFLLTICTNFSVGLIKVIPFKLHGIVEVVVSVVLIFVAFGLGSMEGDLARNFYIGFGLVVFITWLITDYTDKHSNM